MNNIKRNINKRTLRVMLLVRLPNVIFGQAVVAIGNSAFANQTQLSQITIPASVGATIRNVFVDF